MKKFLIIFISLNFILLSCSKDDTHDELLNATVLNKGIDCGDLFLIQFSRDVSGLPKNDFDNIYYALNLPEAFKIEGKKVKVQIRAPKNEEAVACTTLGIGYPGIYIITVE